MADVDLEDEQFKRARKDSSQYPHYELKSTDDDDEYIDTNKTTPINKQKRNSESINLFGTNFDDEDDVGDFPFDNPKKQSTEQKQPETKIQLDIEEYNIDMNPLYLYNYWQRYQTLTLNWPNCDGNCGNKLGKLIHNELYGKSTSEYKASASDLSVLYIDNYVLNNEDINTLRSFAILNPMSIETDQIIQMWSFIDSLKGKVDQHMQQQTEIAHESKVHELINKDIESTLKVKEIISKHFLCYSTPIRRYLISLLHSFEHIESESIDEDYGALLKLLKHKENIICDDEQTLDIWSRLTAFKDCNKYFILYQLSRYSCYNNNMTLFQELKRNGFHTISPNLYTNDMVRIIKTKEYALMRKYNLELTAEEIISILIYTGSDQISKSVRESLIMEQRSCKWMHLTGNLVSAVEKMHKILVQTKYQKDLPSQLYYAIGGANIKTKQIKYFDVISTTSNKDLALKFMQKGTMIVFDKANYMLQNTRFIAAPLNWLTSRKNNNNFQEWLVTCIKIHNIEKKKNNDGNGYTITCIDYETVNFRGMATWRKVIDASMILDQPNQALQRASNASCINDKNWKCMHCQCIAPFYCYQGNILLDNMECIYCRRYNLFSFNCPNRIIACFCCGKETMLKEYHIDMVNKQRGAKCSICKQFQVCGFEKSMQFKEMLKWLCIDDGYKEKLRNEKLRREQQKKLREEQRLKRVNKVNEVDNSGGIQASKKQKIKEKKSGGLFKWGKAKKQKIVKSSNLNDIEENPAILENDFD